MRLRSEPELSAKVPNLSQAGLASLSTIISILEAATKEAILSSTPPLEIHALGNDIWVSRLGGLRVFFTIAGEGDESYVLLLDISEEVDSPTTRPFILRDPKTNSSLNPFRNPSLNPKQNPQLNPKFNASINPQFNASLNPQFNASLNPRFSASINPRFNATLNPRYNWAVNPERNFAINPNRNRMFGGPFLYDLELERRGFVIRANEQARLVFDNEAKYKGLLVRASDQVSAYLDDTGHFLGFFVKGQNDVEIGYDRDANWNLLVV